jgi:hypothetical protein
LTPWAESVGAIVAMFMPGQEEGNALADVLFGDVDAGGRLPVTFPNKVPLHPTLLLQLSLPQLLFAPLKSICG